MTEVVFKVSGTDASMMRFEMRLTGPCRAVMKAISSGRLGHYGYGADCGKSLLCPIFLPTRGR